MSLGSFQGRGGIIAGRRQGENSVPNVEQAGIPGWGMCSQEPEEGWEAGALSVLWVEPMRTEFPLCPAVSHPAVLSLRAWDILTWGDTPGRI